MATSLAFFPAHGAIIPKTGGAAVEFVDGTNFDYIVLAFEGADGSADNLVIWKGIMPDSYGGGDLTWRVYWVPDSGAPASENCSFDVSILGRVDDEALDAAFSDTITINDPVTAAGDLQVAEGDMSTPTLTAGDYIIVQLNRDYDEANGGTALGEDALVLGVQMLEA